MPASLLTRNVIALAGYVAFALVYRELSGALAYHYLVFLPEWLGLLLWPMVAIVMAGIANRRAFQFVTRRDTRLTLRLLFVGSSAASCFASAFWRPCST
jgi:hypothetical protein